jgi:putative addiction module killer protein
MIEIFKTDVFADWLNKLKDIKGRAKIMARIERLRMGNPGDVKALGDGIYEIRIHYGPGYRVYYKHQNQRTIILLAGGDKKTQERDIKRAIELAQKL